MLEIRWHGRGGQGVWSASILLATAAIKTGKYAQSFPEFGPERTGAPVQAYNRIDDKPIVVHASIYEPDIVIVIDPTLLENGKGLLAGIKANGHLLVNTSESPEEIRKKLDVRKEVKVWTVDATTIALEEMGRAITNTPMLGALLKAFSVVPLDSIKAVVRERWPGEIGEKNIRAIERALKEVKTG
ncbi:MAG: pyruvate synthase subunit porC [Thermoproteota archaeon]|nr:MAG: pyruvate synthase subunit porC [Candidatus Korarchaeota archaeon]